MALEWCEAPTQTCADDPTLGCSEPEDAEDRSRWQACVIRHHAAVKCLRALERAGLMRRSHTP